MVWNFRDARKWIPDKIVQKLGPVTYSVDIGAARTVKKHTDQLTKCLEPSAMSTLLPSPDADTTIADNFQ